MIAWREYQERLPSDEELHQWFDGEDINAIGLVTGKISRVVVLDVDSIKQEYQSPIMVKTISGGTHSYFKWTEEMRNDAGIEDKPIDFRGDGGFVVLPPSSLGKQSYSWMKRTDTMFLSPVPEDLKQKLKIRKTFDTPKQEFTDYSSGLPKAAEGNRNMVAAQVAGILAGGISPKLLPLIGYGIFSYWNKSHVTPPLPENELQRTWQSIVSRHKLNHPDEQADPYKIFSGENALSEYKALEKQYGKGLSTGFSVLDNYFKFLPEQLYLLSAPTHQGKTTLALNIAGRIASTMENVLFCSLEQGIFIAPRIEQILSGPFPQSLSILTSTTMMSTEMLIQAVEQMQEKPRLVVVDHLHFVKKDGKGTTEDIDTMILSLQNMAKVLKLPVLLIAHVRKLNADRPPTLDDLRDSSSLSQVPSVVMLLYRRMAADMTVSQSYLENEGVLLIAKNRIQGKTGGVKFNLLSTGEFVF